MEGRHGETASELPGKDAASNAFQLLADLRRGELAPKVRKNRFNCRATAVAEAELGPVDYLTPGGRNRLDAVLFKKTLLDPAGSQSLPENPLLYTRRNFSLHEGPMGLMIRSSAIHAAACYTTSPIRKGARVIEYTGPRIRKAEADRLYEDSPITYLFGIGSRSMVIDGHGAAMFLNHSCDPNCETDEIGDRV
jgi:SET domain